MRISSLLSMSGVVFALAMLPAEAQDSNRKLVKSGVDEVMGRKVSMCVDQNSIVKSANGFVQFDTLLDCAVDEVLIRVEYVNCNQDMSGEKIVTKSVPYSKGGAYDWTKARKESTLSISLAGQSAKFVCHK